MSKVLGCNCVLIPRGHQNKKILNLNTMLIDNEFQGINDKYYNNVRFCNVNQWNNQPA